ncbi:hypothetical protein BD310DRAFT_676645 [Dichomitus squalens]|uniref:Uncharacterized protein n=1 Tax=Dichomitus squalens TaxID=114155 RepID=A0A4Q9PN99_9APHY|nr:hypothetical protein BD310DRAFT_676645 [Dichomitus squalens]
MLAAFGDGGSRGVTTRPDNSRPETRVTRHPNACTRPGNSSFPDIGNRDIITIYGHEMPIACQAF